MALSIKQEREKIINEILEKIDQNTSLSNKDLIKKFAKQYFLSISREDLRSRSTMSLCDLVISHWIFIKKRSKEDKIKVYNPNIEDDKWESLYTIIDLISDDVPFLIESIRMVLNRLHIDIHLMIYVVGLKVGRKVNGEIEKIMPIKGVNKDEDISKEITIRIKIMKIIDKKLLEKIKKEILLILDDIKLVVNEWKDMQNVLISNINALEKAPPPIEKAKFFNSIKFLKWILHNHFTFFGCCEYKLIKKHDKCFFKPLTKTTLGLFKKNEYGKKCHLSHLPANIDKFYFSDDLLVMGKLNVMSTIHRPAYLDFISIKIFDEKKNVIGEKCFIGLYTAMAYNSSVREIPLIKEKTNNILKLSGFSLSNYDSRALLNIIENLPRDDVFHATERQLEEMVVGILHLQERQKIKLFIRQDVFERFFSCLVFVPKDKFTSALREEYQKILLKELNGDSISFSTSFSESVLARIHFIIRLKESEKIEYSIKDIEEKLIEVSKTWEDKLTEVLDDKFTKNESGNLLNLYVSAFSEGYKENFSAENAVIDIEQIEKLIKYEEDPIAINMYHSANDDVDVFRVKLFNINNPMFLFKVVPIFENLGLKIISERPYKIVRSDEKIIWINDYRMKCASDKCLTPLAVKDIFQHAFKAIWFKIAENDKFNMLVLSEKLNWREIALLRAFYKYLWQVGIGVSQNIVAQALNNNSHIALKLVKLFDLRFNPANKNSLDVQHKIKEEIETDLEKVDSLTEDMVFRDYLNAIFATIRTNYYQYKDNEECLLKNYFSFKFESSKVPNIPLPRPLYEIFVYSPRVEGIHLRAAKIARGGLRWSDRTNDFRTEILGLMKAQQIKNAVIVPHGAKGGFVVKNIQNFVNYENKMEEVRSCYKIFIKGLLDITDNKIKNKNIHPKNVVYYDEDDSYLVVAADRGTAKFSDTANEIAKNYNFWLSDAFASGGSNGYDHKKMGITAKGVWEAVKNHFYNLKININEPFSVIGIGSMAGDVFGNGMLLSNKIKLVACFNHSHIFIDPSPDLKKSYNERKKIFNMERSNWTDYNKSLISKGGGVFSRSSKFIEITKQIKELLDIDKDKNKVTSNELIKYILKANVDLLWNGGIGTYVKSSLEFNTDVGDSANDFIRVNANDLNVKVVAEGGNLGFTQLARVEYSKNGGMINTDAIDNSAGVNCSDKEVNIKILLNDVMHDGKLTEKKRNKLLMDMKNEVINIVLNNNTKQNQSISNVLFRAAANLNMHNDIINFLVKTANLNKKVEFLPDEEEISKRKNQNQGLMRPEIAVLLSYIKIQLQDELKESDFLQDQILHEYLEYAFPKILSKKYKEYMLFHPLKKEIIATEVSNSIVDETGILFVYTLKEETGVKSADIVRAYFIVREIFEYRKLIERVMNLNDNIKKEVKLSIVFAINKLMLRYTRWFLLNKLKSLDFDINKLIRSFKESVSKIEKHFEKILQNAEASDFSNKITLFIAEGIDEKMSFVISKKLMMSSILDIVEGASDNDIDAVDFAKIFFFIGDKLHLNWFRKKVNQQIVHNGWEALSRSSIKDDIDMQQKKIAISICKFLKNAKKFNDKLFDKWRNENNLHLTRWNHFTDEMKNQEVNFTMFAVIVKELFEIVEAVSK